MKYWFAGGIVSLLAIAAGYSLPYRVYLSEGTKLALKQVDFKSAVDGYALCGIHNRMIPQTPHEECLAFFLSYVPGKFEGATDDNFPIAFANAHDLAERYYLVQKDLEEFGEERLPSLKELTKGYM